MILRSYRYREISGQCVEIDVSKMDPDAIIELSTSDRGMLVQIITKKANRVFNLLPHWVHKEFYVFLGDDQVMIRKQRPKSIEELAAQAVA